MPVPSSTPRPTVRPVHKAVHRPLTIAGVERRLFFLALLIGAVAFNVSYSFVAGIVVTAALYALALWAAAKDARMLQILLSASRFHRQYDPMKYIPTRVEITAC